MDWFLTFPESAPHNVSEICKLHVWKSVEHIARGTLWALKMFDSSSKIPGSVLMGNLADFGNYDECLEVTVKEKWGSFVGQHCMMVVPVSLDRKIIDINVPVSSVPLALSLCIPSTCSASDLEKMITSVTPTKVVVPDILCHHRNQERPLDSADWIAILVLTILSLLSIAGTVHTKLVKQKEMQLKGLALFSWETNGRSLLATKSSPDSIPVLHGIRFFSIAWVILGHSVQCIGFIPMLNFLNKEEDIRTWSYLPFPTGVYAVDTFFVLSGALLCYIFMKTMDKGICFNLPVFYLHRLLRIIPVLAVMVLLQASILGKISSGPIWEIGYTGHNTEICKKNWWRTLLFIQNYSPPAEMCLEVSWFLAVDLHMYLLSPIFLLSLHKKPKLGFGLIGATTLLGIGLAFQQGYENKDKSSFIQGLGIVDPDYYRTHMRCIPWIFGVALGYVLYRTTDWRNRVAIGEAQLSKKIVVVGWMFSTTACLGAMWAMYPFQQHDYVYSATEAALYTAFARQVWALGIAWIIFACASGYGGFVNTILSWKALLPFSRLTFSIYLIHLVVIEAYLSMTKTSIYISNFGLFLDFFGYLVISLLSSVVMTLMVESPVIGLEKILFNKANGKSKYRRSADDESLEKKSINLSLGTKYL